MVRVTNIDRDGSVSPRRPAFRRSSSRDGEDPTALPLPGSDEDNSGGASLRPIPFVESTRPGVDGENREFVRAEAA